MCICENRLNKVDKVSRKEGFLLNLANIMKQSICSIFDFLLEPMLNIMN